MAMATATATATDKENDGVMHSLNRKLVISGERDEKVAKEFSASSSSRSRRSGGHERSLDLCLRLDTSMFMCLSIPGMTTTLENLLSSSKKQKNKYYHHQHDDIPNRLDSNHDITADRFPFIFPGFKGPFPLPGSTHPLFSSAVLGRTLYILGGNPHDLPGFDEINDECFNMFPKSQPRKNSKQNIPQLPWTTPDLGADLPWTTPEPVFVFDSEPVFVFDWGDKGIDSGGVDIPQTTSPPVWGWDDDLLTPTPTPTALTSPPTDVHTTEIFTDPSTDPTTTFTLHVGHALTTLWEAPRNIQPQPSSMTRGVFFPLWSDDFPTDPTFTDGHVDTSTSLRTLPKQVKPLPFTVYRDDPSPVITASASTLLSRKTRPARVRPITTIPKYRTKPIKGICHNIWKFDLDNPDLGWSQGKPLISPRIYPILVPYQGKLYAFSGNHPSHTFAEVYDPICATWTALPLAPFRRLHHGQMQVVPLNGWNKLWVFGTHRSVDYTFDVLTQSWQKFSGARVVLPHLIEHQNLVSALTPQKHMVVYWVNQMEEVYAYNLSTNQIFKGIISGAEINKPLLRLTFPLVLHHLRHDLFCLIGCTFLRKPSRKVLHVVILQISLKTPPSSKPHASSKTPPNPLCAAVLACFGYPLKKDINIKDTYLMSKC